MEVLGDIETVQAGRACGGTGWAGARHAKFAAVLRQCNDGRHTTWAESVLWMKICSDDDGCPRGAGKRSQSEWKTFRNFRGFLCPV